MLDRSQFMICNSGKQLSLINTASDIVRPIPILLKLNSKSQVEVEEEQQSSIVHQRFKLRGDGETLVLYEPDISAFNLYFYSLP